MITLLSAYEKSTQNLVFRVYAEPIPETDRRVRNQISHLAACDLLGAALFADFGIRHVKIRREGMEKPYLLEKSLFMNLSHCKGLAVCAIAGSEIGIDAESPRRLREQILPRICTESETAWILSQEDKNLAFTRIWTLKEAYGKYTGRGIRENFAALDFSLSPEITLRGAESENLRFFQLIRENSHVVSVCVPFRGALTLTHAPEWALIGHGRNSDSIDRLF